MTGIPDGLLAAKGKTRIAWARHRDGTGRALAATRRINSDISGNDTAG